MEKKMMFGSEPSSEAACPLTLVASAGSTSSATGAGCSLLRRAALLS
jgi:hypothetical protein